MSGGNGNDRGNGATTSRSGAARSGSSAGRPDKPTDLPPLRSFRDRLPWLPWALAGLLGVLVLVLTLNALDFSRREQLLERRLEMAVADQDELRETLDTQTEEPAPTTSTSAVPLTVPGNAAFLARQRELQEQADELQQRSDELDRREAALDERERALATTLPENSDGTTPSFASGVFLVGIDLPAGIYRTDAPAGCRYSTIGNDGVVIEFDLRPDAGPVTLEIGEDVHRVDSNGCGTWVLVG
mgnify:CR=1 FL=1